jgi:mannosyltransferase OCH1-like enzyme
METLPTKTLSGQEFMLLQPPKIFPTKPFGDKYFQITTKDPTEKVSVRQVPKLIHQTWKTKEIPEIWKDTAEKWKTVHPSYQYILWTDEDLEQLVSTAYPWALKVFLELPYGIQRADMGRVFVLHSFGGVYSDLDIVPKRSITPLIQFFENDETGFDVALVEGPTGFCGLNYSNFFMFSFPRVSWWMNYFCYVMNEGWHELQPWYIRALMNIHHYKIMASTGPAAISVVHSAVMKNAGINTHVMTIPTTFINTQQTFPEDVNVRFTQLEGRSWCKNSTSVAIGAKKIWEHRDAIGFPVFFVTLILFIVFLILFVKYKR